jgi:hypothetical protein
MPHRSKTVGRICSADSPSEPVSPPSGVLVESRALRPDAKWVFVQTVSSGDQFDVELGGEGRMYRVVKR